MYWSRCASLSWSKNRCPARCVRASRSPQKLSCNSSTKCWYCSVIGVTFAMGVSLFSKESVSAFQAKTNLHPLAFYTIEVTSPALQKGKVASPCIRLASGDRLKSKWKPFTQLKSTRQSGRYSWQHPPAAWLLSNSTLGCRDSNRFARTPAIFAKKRRKRKRD